MKDWLIDKPMNNKLNKLKKSNPEVFFYWYKIYKLRTEAKQAEKSAIEENEELALEYINKNKV